MVAAQTPGNGVPRLDARGGKEKMPEETLIGRKVLPGAILAVAVLVIMVMTFASSAHAATVHGTKNHDWGAAKDMFSDPPGCGASCGKIIRGTGAGDTIYGHQGWDYIAAFGGSDVVYGGLGMEIIHGDDGDDLLFGQRGHDHIYGGRGNDRIHAEDGKDERDNVEQVAGEGGRDKCVVDEDPRDGLIVNGTCETVVIKSVPNMSGATKIYGTHMAKDDGNSIPGKFYPGTYHWD